VVNVASREQVELANHTSAEWPDEDDWTLAGVTGLPDGFYTPVGDIFRLARPDWEQLRDGGAPPVVSADTERAGPVPVPRA
jgi:hypothetical protein